MLASVPPPASTWALRAAVGRASLGGEIPWVSGLPLGVVVHLAGDEQDGLSSGDLDGLAVSGRVEDGFRSKPLDLGSHINSPLYMMVMDSRSRPYPDTRWRMPAQSAAHTTS